MDELKLLPFGMQLLNAIWSYPDRMLQKHKSHICVDGSQQQYGIDYWNTYAPVIQWSTVCLMLILSSMLSLACWQLDYIQAFP